MTYGLVLKIACLVNVLLAACSVYQGDWRVFAMCLGTAAWFWTIVTINRRHVEELKRAWSIGCDTGRRTGAITTVRGAMEYAENEESRGFLEAVARKNEFERRDLHDEWETQLKAAKERT